MCRPAWRIRNTSALHPQPEAVRCRHHGAGSCLYTHHGDPTQTTCLLPQRILHIQVYPDCTKLYYSLHVSHTLVFAPRAFQKSWLDLDLKSFCLPVCRLRLCLQEGSIYLRRSCTPTWRAVGWEQFWWGEAKSWRWCRKTSTSVRTTRWETAGLYLSRRTHGRDSDMKLQLVVSASCFFCFFCWILSQAWYHKWLLNGA